MPFLETARWLADLDQECYDLQRVLDATYLVTNTDNGYYRMVGADFRQICAVMQRGPAHGS